MTDRPPNAARLWEVDALRGVAITMMVVYHLLFDLSSLAGYDINVYTGFWRVWARATASLFIVLVGVSLTLSLVRARQKAPGAPLFGKYLRRGLGVFACGLLVTAGTGLLFPEAIVTFGILHFIGTSIVLAYPFLGLGWANLPLGLACIALGLYVGGITLPFPWLLWLGLAPTGYMTFDYFPLLPWFGLVLLGIWLGGVVYPGHMRRFRAARPERGAAGAAAGLLGPALAADLPGAPACAAGGAGAAGGREAVLGATGGRVIPRRARRFAEGTKGTVATEGTNGTRGTRETR